MQLFNLPSSELSATLHIPESTDLMAFVNPTYTSSPGTSSTGAGAPAAAAAAEVEDGMVKPNVSRKEQGT